MAKKAKTFKPGDRVAYSAAFLRSTGQIAGPAGKLRGSVVSVKNFGSVQLCVIAWDNYKVKS